jgi:hypothetical protein
MDRGADIALIELLNHFAFKGYQFFASHWLEKFAAAIVERQVRLFYGIERWRWFRVKRWSPSRPHRT